MNNGSFALARLSSRVGMNALNNPSAYKNVALPLLSSQASRRLFSSHYSKHPKFYDVVMEAQRANAAEINKNPTEDKKKSKHSANKHHTKFEYEEKAKFKEEKNAFKTAWENFQKQKKKFENSRKVSEELLEAMKDGLHRLKSNFNTFAKGREEFILKMIKKEFGWSPEFKNKTLTQLLWEGFKKEAKKEAKKQVKEFLTELIADVISEKEETIYDINKLEDQLNEMMKNVSQQTKPITNLDPEYKEIVESLENTAAEIAEETTFWDNFYSQPIDIEKALKNLSAKVDQSHESDHIENEKIATSADSIGKKSRKKQPFYFTKLFQDLRRKGMLQQNGDNTIHKIAEEEIKKLQKHSSTRRSNRTSSSKEADALFHIGEEQPHADTKRDSKKKSEFTVDNKSFHIGQKPKSVATSRKRRTAAPNAAVPSRRFTASVKNNHRSSSSRHSSSRRRASEVGNKRRKQNIHESRKRARIHHDNK